MLHDQERGALYEIEFHLTTQDPLFANRMQANPTPPFPTVPVLCACLFITLPLVGLLAGWLAGVLTLGAGVAGIAAVPACRRRTRRHDV
jgi:hypothetical protein